MICLAPSTVALDEAVLGQEHPAVGIGKVSWRLWVQALLKAGEEPAPSACGSPPCVSPPLRVGFGFRRRGGRGLRLKRLSRLADFGQALLFVRDPAGHFVAATACAVEFVLLRVGGLRSFKPAIHLGAKRRLGRLHAFVAHRLVLGGVRLDLHAVGRDLPQLRQTGFFRQLQHLQKQPPQSRRMTLPEVGDRAKIWRVVRHDHHEIDPLGAGLRDPPRRIKTRAIGIEQQGRQHARIERRVTKPAFVACDNLRQFEALARQSDDELRQMVRRHIIDDRRRQELRLINLPRSKMSAHVAKELDSPRKRHHY